MTTKKVVTAVGSSTAVASAASAPSGTGGSNAGTATASPPSSLALGTKEPKGFRLKLQQMVAGLSAVIPDSTSIPTLQAGTLTKADMVSQLTQGLTQYAAVDDAEITLTQARASLTGDLPALKAYYDQVKEALKLFFGKNSLMLAKFGLVVAKPKAPLTPEQQLAANARNKQTRGLRHTAGPKQKAQVQFQGQVAVTATVSGTPSTVAPATAPAQDSAPVASPPGK